MVIGSLCDPCGIMFSSKKTLEAHQKYYCSDKLGRNRRKSETSLNFIKSQNFNNHQKIILNHGSNHESGKLIKYFYAQSKHLIIAFKKKMKKVDLDFLNIRKLKNKDFTRLRS